MEAPICICGKKMELHHQCIYHPEEGVVWVCKKCQQWNIRGCIREAINALASKPLPEEVTLADMTKCLKEFKDAFGRLPREKLH